MTNSKVVNVEATITDETTNEELVIEELEEVDETVIKLGNGNFTESKIVNRRYNYGFTPTPQQEVFLEAVLNASRVVYNDTLAFERYDIDMAKLWYEERGVSNQKEWYAKNGIVGKTSKAKQEYAELHNIELYPYVKPQIRAITNAKYASSKGTVKASADGKPFDLPYRYREEGPALEDEKFIRYGYLTRNPDRSFIERVTFDEPRAGLFEIRIPNVCLQQSSQDATEAVRKFWDNLGSGKRTRFPKFKKHGENDSLAFTNMHLGRKVTRKVVASKDGSKPTVTIAVKLPNFLDYPIIIKTKRNLPSEPQTVTIKKLPTGKWVISFIVKVEVKLSPKTDIVAGIDLGFKDMATIVYHDLNNEKPDEIEVFRNLKNDKNFNRRNHHVARLQQQLAKMEKGSKNYEKKKRQIAKYISASTKTRKLEREKLANTVTAKSDIISMETLSLKGMAKKGTHEKEDGTKQKFKRFGKSVGNSSLGALVLGIQSKAEELEKTSVKIGRYVPSTKTCSECHAPTGPSGAKELHIRHWVCSECGADHDRDVNASINIYRNGLLVLEELKKEKNKTRKKS